MTKAIRGAVQFAQDEKQLISKRVCRLIEKMIDENEIREDQIVSIVFSVTKDILSINPAAALRSGGGYKAVPLFCTQEPDCEDSMEKVVRVLMTFNVENNIMDFKHIYLDGAEKLRPDLS